MIRSDPTPYLQSSTAALQERKFLGNGPDVSKPEVGFYKARMIKAGAWCAARIWLEPPIDPVTGDMLDRPPMMLAELDGKEISAHDLWMRVAGRNITEAEYRYLAAARRWAETYAPDDPRADPRKAVDLRATAPILPPGR